MTRPATEEWNLAAFQHDQDVTNAEFQRTFRNVDFPGGQLVQRLDAELKRTKSQEVRKVIPATDNGTEVYLKYFPDLYGYRGHLPEALPVYYLNPWEFLMWWEVKRLPKPRTVQEDERTVPDLTKWVKEETGEFKLNDAAVKYYAKSKRIVFYRENTSGLDLRNIWYMERHPHKITIIVR